LKAKAISSIVFLLLLLFTVSWTASSGNGATQDITFPVLCYIIQKSNTKSKFRSRSKVKISKKFKARVKPGHLQKRKVYYVNILLG